MTHRQSMMLPAAVVSVVLTMMSLSQVFDRQRWFFPSLFGVLVAFGVGWAARRLDVPGFLAPAVSLLAMLTFLGVVFVPETTLAGLPTPDTMRAIGDLLSAAGTDLREMAPPAEATDALTLLATGGVFLVAMVVDLVVFWTRRPVAAGMPLLALFLIPTSMTDKANVFAFVLAAVGYLTLLVAEGRDRARGWGRRLSGMELVDDVADVSHVVRVGRRIGSAAVGVALCVPLLVPSVGQGIFRGTGGNGLFGRGNGSRTATVINPLVEIKAQLQDDRIVPLLDVRTTEPQYLRLTSLDSFNGDEWSLVKRDVKSDHRVGEDKPLRLPRELESIDAPSHRYEIAVRDLAVHWLPIPYVPSLVDVDGDWRYEEFGYSVFSAERTSRGVRFTADSRLPEPTIEQLKAPGEIPAKIREEYLGVPANTPDIANDVLAEVTTGKENAYDIALALNEYFFSSGQFTYDDDVPQASGVDALTHFLTVKRGYCEQYAATMAYLARLKGIPARVVVGFTPGTLQNDGRYVVTNKDAHAWPELYFPRTGWVRFEPTPRDGTVRPGYGIPPAPVGSETPTPGETPSAEPSSAPNASPSTRPQNVPEDPGDAGPDPALGGGDDGGVPVAPLAAGGVLLLATTPALVGMGTRRRRRTAAVDDAGRIHAAWESLADAAEDAGYPLRDADSPRGAARRLVAAASLSGPVADEVRRVAAAEERARYARTVPSVEGLDGGVRTVRKAMIAALPRRARLRATVFPASSVRRIAGAVRAVGDGVDRARTRIRLTLLSVVRRRRTRAA
jgi:transglutaminase-like putative cysteine protease